MNKASWRPPHTFLVLNDKGGGRSIKAWRPSSVFFLICSAWKNQTVRFCKLDCSVLSSIIFHISFHSLYQWTWALYLMCELSDLWLVITRVPLLWLLMSLCSMMSYSCLNMYVWTPWNHWSMFPYQYVVSEKTGGSDFINRMFQFWWFCLAKPGYYICFSYFICCDSLIMCITYYMFTHTFIAPLGCIYIDEALLGFFEKCAKWYLYTIRNR
jgi:hypothetical protein